jgi:DnaJ-class molecular chaperone
MSKNYPPGAAEGDAPWNKKENPCENCGGTGVKTCTQCEGVGVMNPGDPDYEEQCDKCKGAGVRNCEMCDGSGIN